VSASAWNPVDARFAERVRASFGKQSFMETLGATLETVEPGHVVIRMPWNGRLLQQHGFFHAGATTAIADSAGGYAALTLFPVGAAVLSVEYKVNLVNAAGGDALVADGRVVKHGRTLTVCDLEVHAVDGEGKTLCLKGLQTVFCAIGKKGTVD